MKAVRGRYLLGMLTVLLSATVLFTAAVEAQTIHALLVIMDDAPRTRQLNGVNLKNIVDLLRDIETQHNSPLALDVLRFSHDDSQTQATGENILNYLATVEPAPDDVVFVYYSGKGGMDPAAAPDISLTLQDGALPRPHITAAMERLECRLKMLITDTVSFDAMWSGLSTSVGHYDSETLGHLFFQHEGFLNITSAAAGEISGGASAHRSKISGKQSQQGGWFTYSFIHAISDSTEDRNEDGFLSWKEVFHGTQEMTIELAGYTIEFPAYVEFSEGYMEESSSEDDEGLLRKFRRLRQRLQRPIYYGELPRRINATPLPTLHVLLVSVEASLDPDEDAVMQARNEIEWLLDDVAETTHCPVNTVHLFASEGEATAAHIQGWLQGVRPARDDVVFLYYIGDGTVDATGELHLNLLDNEKIPRKTIAASMQQLTCRLKILITDAGSQGPPVTDPVDFLAEPYREGVSYGVSQGEMFKHLFFEHEGFLNLTAATEGELVAFGNRAGRLFTQAFIHAIYNYKGDTFILWTHIFRLARQKTMDLFHENASEFPNAVKQHLREKRVESQRPKSYGDLPNPIQH